MSGLSPRICASTVTFPEGDNYVYVKRGLGGDGNNFFFSEYCTEPSGIVYHYHDGKGEKMLVPGGKELVSDGECLRFRPSPPELIDPFPVFPDECYDFCGKEVRFSLLYMDKTEKIPFVHKKLLKNALDYDKIRGKLFLRQKQDGDRYHPVGRDGKSLKKLFQEADIPPEERLRIPVLCDEEGILLVDGFGCDRRASVTENTQVVLRMECCLS